MKIQAYGYLRGHDQVAIMEGERLEFLEEPASFFYDGDQPLRAEEIADPYRRGMLLTARATSLAERAWLREALGEGAPAPADDTTT